MNKFKEKILMISESCEGKSFEEIDKKNILSEQGNKGALGHVIEMNVFGYNRNNNSQMDFPKAGMELKVTPYKKNKNGTYSAKERLVLNIIDYMNEYKNDFYDSSFWLKNSNILLFFYEHKYNLPRKKFKITHIYDMEYDRKDLKIFMQDYDIIRKKILDGKAHEISEADTMYLGACTKGSTALKSYRRQPFNSKKAKQRAYSFKTTYMTQLVREIIKSEKYETIFLDEELNEKITFEENIRNKVREYFGMSVDELKEFFNIKNSPKNLNEILFARMLDVKTKLSNTEEFLKANIVPKTIRINNKSKIKESMSFPTFKFKKIVKQEWEETRLYEYFYTHKFLFVVFKENTSGEYIFSEIKLWNMPYEVLEIEIRKVFDKTKEVIQTGNIIRKIAANGSRLNNLPGMRFNYYAHVRPHAQNKNDTYPLPVPDKLTGDKDFMKQSFWLNSKYIVDVLNGV